MATQPRKFQKDGYTVEIVGPSSRCQVWINGQPALGLQYFKSLRAARSAAFGPNGYTKRHAATPTYASLQAAWEAEFAGERWDGLAGEVSNLMDSGRVNANDTVHKEKAAPESEWEGLFISTLELHLGCEASEAAREWFKRHGVTY